MARININGLKRELAHQYLKKFIKQTQIQVNKEVARVKKQMIEKFNSHQVTKDIEAGPSANNLGQRGNLFSLIGFDSSDNPTVALRQVLLNSLSVKVYSSGVGQEISFLVNIDLPTQEEVRSATPLPWAPGRSWVDEVERGVSGLGRYLVKPSASSRSGAAIQVEGQVNSGRMGPIPYISQIIKSIARDISSIKI